MTDTRKTPMIGRRFGRLVVVRLAYRDKRRQLHWECRCDCGRTSTPGRASLIDGKTTSCGHHLKRLNIKHGYSPVGRTPTYRSWTSMLARCRNANTRDYKEWYGGRGIKVCKRWEKFENFLADIGERPEGMTLDRKNPNGNYTPRNCRWATNGEQRTNRRKSRSRKI